MEKEVTFRPYSEAQEKFGLWFIKHYGRWQTRVYEWTGGRVWHKFLGVECAILTTVGRKSGEPRKSPLLYLRRGDEVVMVASKGGMGALPLWYRNIQANPRVDIQIGGEKKSYRGRDATPEEEAALWPPLDELYAGYAEYRARVAGKRHIPLVIFEPLA